jgi:DNA-binding NarL/FixJ family response regulator
MRRMEAAIAESAPSRRPVRVLLADANGLARNSLRETLQRAGLSVVGPAADIANAVSLTRRCTPDVIVMDSTLPPGGGIAALPVLMAASPRVRVVILAESGDDDTGLVALSRGAVGYLSRDIDLRALARAVARVARGEAAVSRSMARRLVECLRTLSAGKVGMRPVKSPLTSREWEVLDLIATGATTSQIARKLVLSTDTVDSHVRHILRKLETHSRAEAVQIAEQMRA